MRVRVNYQSNTRTLVLTRTDLLELLKLAGTVVPDGAHVVFDVPGGGDWSNTAVDLCSNVDSLDSVIRIVAPIPAPERLNETVVDFGVDEIRTRKGVESLGPTSIPGCTSQIDRS
jgi:hypothetical protein